MSHKRNEALRHVQHSMHHVIAAGEGSDRAPDSCKLCPYYRPDFKFRTCLYAHCPYKKQVNVFRSTPEKWDILYSHVADKLLRDGRVRLKDCKSAKGKTYNAIVLLSCEADGRSKFSLEFEGGC